MKSKKTIAAIAVILVMAALVSIGQMANKANAESPQIQTSLQITGKLKIPGRTQTFTVIPGKQPLPDQVSDTYVETEIPAETEPEREFVLDEIAAVDNENVIVEAAEQAPPVVESVVESVVEQLPEPEIPWQNDGNSEELTDLPYSDEELELLAITIYCEAGGDEASNETRRMVGEVVLNRIADPRFPNTMIDVLTAKRQYGRFFWTGVVWPSRAAFEPEAVARAYECARQVFTEERLLPPDTVFQAEFFQGTEIVVKVPGFWFCR